MRLVLRAATGGFCAVSVLLAARGATPSAFERRCIPSGCVAPPSNIPDILGRHALPAGRITALGATMDLHHGLLAAAQERVSFNRDMRPIMSDTCFRCHGPDKNARMAGMRLDIRDEALKPTRSGRTPIVPGDPDKSAIVARIFASGAEGRCRRRRRTRS